MSPGWISNFTYRAMFVIGGGFICQVALGWSGVIGVIVGASIAWAVEQD